MLSKQERYEIIIATFLFLLFWGFIRKALMDKKIRGKNIFITTLLFFTWITLSKIISNSAAYANSRYFKSVRPYGGMEQDEEYNKAQWEYLH